MKQRIGTFDVYMFDRLPSTQVYLADVLTKKHITAPAAVICKEQTEGIGSRENQWEGMAGNFFASIAVPLSLLPEDLPLASASIYFSFLMKKVLQKEAESLWLKWPNDFYTESKKAGGTITQKVGNILVCGMGINLKTAREPYGALFLKIDALEVLERYLIALEKFPKWKQVFSEYRVEFEKSKGYSVHIENRRKSLENAQLCEDGSLFIEGKKVYSSR